jgi:hypothetical protein
MQIIYIYNEIIPRSPKDLIKHQFSTYRRLLLHVAAIVVYVCSYPAAVASVPYDDNGNSCTHTTSSAPKHKMPKRR